MLQSFRYFAKAAPAPLPLFSYNYDKHGRDWEVAEGKAQSPVALSMCKSSVCNIEKLNFLNYDKTLAGPLLLSNNGHTAYLNITVAENGVQPAVCGCTLNALYKALQLHFHWGSPKTKGSEHTIDSERYDAELHIVHRNCMYNNNMDALCSTNGFVILGILLQCVESPKVEPIGLNKIFETVKLIKSPGLKTTLPAKLKLNDLIADLDMQEFFTYKGSLTTPPCPEAVDWFVFAKPVDISYKYLQNLWCLKDKQGKPLENNYRALQRLKGRKVLYRTGKDISKGSL